MNEGSSAKHNKMEFMSKKLYVKYMVCLRDKIIVKSELEKLGIPFRFSPHDAIEFYNGIPKDQFDQLNKNLRNSGLILLNESESKLIDKIINTIIEIIHYSDKLPKVSFMDLIDLHSIPGNESILKVFSDVKGMSILQFIVLQKIERAKELLLYDDIPLTEIAGLLNYKNQHYLLAQFKKVTGLTPSYFKRLKNDRQKFAEQRFNKVYSSASGIKSQSSS